MVHRCSIAIALPYLSFREGCIALDFFRRSALSYHSVFLTELTLVSFSVVFSSASYLVIPHSESEMIAMRLHGFFGLLMLSPALFTYLFTYRFQRAAGFPTSREP